MPPKVLEANPDIEPGADIQKMTDVGAWLAGPIVRDKLWFAGTWHDQRMDQHYLGGYNPDGSQAIDDNVLWNYTAKVSWQATKSAQLSYFTDIQYKLNGHFVQGNTRASFGDDASKQHVYKYPTDPPGEVHDADPQQHGVRHRLQPVPVRQRVPAAARGQSRRHRAVRQRDLGAVGRLHARHVQRRRLRRLLHDAALPRTGAHQPDDREKPRTT